LTVSPYWPGSPISNVPVDRLPPPSPTTSPSRFSRVILIQTGSAKSIRYSMEHGASVTRIIRRLL
jgi:hypothetical protein